MAAGNGYPQWFSVKAGIQLVRSSSFAHQTNSNRLACNSTSTVLPGYSFGQDSCRPRKDTFAEDHARRQRLRNYSGHVVPRNRQAEKGAVPSMGGSFAFSLLLVFLFLAASLFEGWTLPFQSSPQNPVAIIGWRYPLHWHAGCLRKKHIRDHSVSSWMIGLSAKETPILILV